MQLQELKKLRGSVTTLIGLSDVCKKIGELTKTKTLNPTKTHLRNFPLVESAILILQM